VDRGLLGISIPGGLGTLVSSRKLNLLGGSYSGYPESVLHTMLPAGELVRGAGLVVGYLRTGEEQYDLSLRLNVLLHAGHVHICL
jgi:hypothetical protein